MRTYVRCKYDDVYGMIPITFGYLRLLAGRADDEAYWGKAFSCFGVLSVYASILTHMEHRFGFGCSMSKETCHLVPGDYYHIMYSQPTIEDLVFRIDELQAIPLTLVRLRTERKLLDRKKNRATSLARWLFIYIAVHKGYSLTAISRYLKRSVSSVAMALQAVEDDLRAGGVWGLRIHSFGSPEQLKALCVPNA